MKNATFLLAFLFYAFSGNAQTNTIHLTGKVVSENGEPLVGVTIYLKNLSAGARSEIDGSFQINMSERDVVIFSYVGWGTCEYTLPEIELEFNNIIVMVESGMVLPETVITSFKVPLINSDCIYCGCCGYCTKEDLPIPITLAAHNWSYAPNPAQDAVVIQTSEATGNILVYSMNGSAVTQVKVTDAETRVELAGYAAGTYILYFENAGLAQNIGKVVLIKN